MIPTIVDSFRGCNASLHCKLGTTILIILNFKQIEALLAPTQKTFDGLLLAVLIPKLASVLLETARKKIRHQSGIDRSVQMLKWSKAFHVGVLIAINRC